MDTKPKTLTIFEFSERFPNDRACLEHLASLKWRDGFVCPKCGHTRYCKGVGDIDRQCTTCSRLVSPTSGTLFHRIKFPLRQAFFIIYYLTTSKSEVSSSELSRNLGMRQKTCWAFKQKVIREMKIKSEKELLGDF